MKKVENKQILVASDFSGFELKEAIVNHLKENGWEVSDVGLQDKNQEDREMFHRIGFRVGSMISEKEFDRALIFCGTGMGIQIAASKCPGVRAGVVENVHSAIRAIQGNDINVLSMGGFYIGNQLGIEIADAFLNNKLGSGNYSWPYFNAFHKLAVDEINEFDYEEYKANNFNLKNKKTLDDYSYLVVQK